MRLHRMTVTAFGPFGATQEIDFDALSKAGLFLLHGPTGAGKTSVLDAVCFALYGAVPGARQSPGTSLRSDHAEVRTPTEVTLELTLGERRLEITRNPAQPRPKARGTGFVTERARSRLREYDTATGQWKALSTSHQEIGEEITQLIGMSREQFCQVVLLPQGDFARFLRADAEARGRLLGRLFDTRRFAAVEERLAELRRGAEQQVRTGDERLLALAHRMEQAAAGAAGDWPAADRQPGDPGLAAAVLQWAAVARAGAREERDIAEARAEAAAERHTAARHALDAARELARLQQRYAETTRRADALEKARPRHDALAAAVDRARRADRVVPALRLRDEAARAHRAALAGRERSRAQLPEDLADADAERLTGREHALRGELGALESARRAERRSAEITRERAEADRQARADEDALHEASVWLAGWEAERRRHTERITVAQEAATRAEHLAGRLAPARARLEAACERDELAARAARAEAALRTLHTGVNEARAHWLDLKERRLRGIAAEIASALVPGEPCAVCGSAEHPAPARAEAGHVDRAAEDAAYEASVRAEQARAAAERDLAVTRESHAAAAQRARAASAARERQAPAAVAGAATGPADGLTAGAGSVGPAGAGTAGAGQTVAADTGRASGAVGAQGESGRVRNQVASGEVRNEGASGGAGTPSAVGSGETRGASRATGVPGAGVPAPREADTDPTVADLRAAVAELERRHAEAHRTASGMHAAQEALERGEREHGERLEACRRAERSIAARLSRREAIDQEQAAIEAELVRARGGAASVADHAARLERRIGLLAAAADALRQLDTAERQVAEAGERLAEAARDAGFETPEEAAEAVLGERARREAEAGVEAWRTEAAAVAERLAEEDAREAAGLSPAAPEAAGSRAAAAERQARDAAARLAAARERCAALDRLSAGAADEVRGLGPLRERYDRVARLAGLTAGTSADNERRMRLESYVLAARLEQVAAAATVRLQRMSSGRYTLVHSDARAGGRRAGLGLHVVDAWTGRERDTATLSGGETFFASLALALGLADVVTDEAGGTRLDTLFVDEGFGSLDEQTLDEVLDVLDSLRERDRSVGIVSHVGDLRRRIPVQLEVVKDRSGSAVRLRTGEPLGD
ncbi:AAA family ATPase [Streptomyces sp. t39]|uniref:AAA family ATPase n=1 Tax=Streptomyces sp. t39 TaxID=1828156 RepID=UPI0011CE10A7|nr:SMC family ATPase [Streptomyces sp. t39]TXS51574.1 SMC family ATPase [Streptomyces sp. t39]